VALHADRFLETVQEENHIFKRSPGNSVGVDTRLRAGRPEFDSRRSNDEIFS